MQRKIVMAGATGFIGRELGIFLAQAGYELHVIARRRADLSGKMPYPCTLYEWHDEPAVLQAACEGSVALINLSGEGIAGRRWSAERRKALLASRLDPIAKLASIVQGCSQKPQVWIQASAVGFYGDRGDDICDETAPSGQGFLADTCRAWEEAMQSVPSSVRQVIMRLGVVLGESGGFLATLNPLYAARIAAQPGNGEQWLSFIHVYDLCRLVEAAIRGPSWQGVVNAVAPNPCRFKELHHKLATYYGRPLLPPVPGAALRLGMGEMADLALASQRVLPAKAVSYGFSWQYPDISAATAGVYQVDGIAAGHSGLIHYDAIWLAADPRLVWDFFSDEKNLEAITPPWLNFKVETTSAPQLGQDVTIAYKLALHGIPLRWRTKLIKWEPQREFIDYQEKGPYALWHHQHRFLELGEGNGVIVVDRVDYRLPLHPLGFLAAGRWVQKDIGKIFAYRKEVLRTRFNT